MKKYHFDLIIANPPYGKVGADITAQVINNIEFSEYVNLQPAGDYTHVKTLTNHIISAETLDRGAFVDAAVTTTLAKLSKNKVNSLSELEFVIKTKQSGLAERYFLANTRRGVPYISRSNYSPDIVAGNVDPNCLLCLGRRDFAHGHLPYTKNRDYDFNYGKIDLKTLLNQVAHTYGDTICWGSDLYIFASEPERNNFRDFMYSKDGYRFYSYLFKAAKVDSSDARLYVFPKVDWTRSWTVQEVLKDYNYTDEEIAQVMEELKKYKLGEMHQD